MFPKSNSLYLTELFKELCEIWLIYHSTSLSGEMAPKWRIAFLHVLVAKKTLYFVEIA